MSGLQKKAGAGGSQFPRGTGMALPVVNWSSSSSCREGSDRPGSSSGSESVNPRRRFPLIAIKANDVPCEFPDSAMAEARAVVRSHTMPEADLTGIPFITIDPARRTRPGRRRLCGT